MLFKILKFPEEISRDFNSVAALMSLMDRPLKNSIAWENVSAVDISRLEIEPCETMKEIFMTEAEKSEEKSKIELGSGAGIAAYAGIAIAGGLYRGIKQSLSCDFVGLKKSVEESIRKLPVKNIMDPKEGGHRQAFSDVLDAIVKDFRIKKNDENKRTMTFWLLMLALDLDDGVISSNKMSFMQDFINYIEVEDDVFDDLIKRAEPMYQELKKSTAIIFE